MNQKIIALPAGACASCIEQFHNGRHVNATDFADGSRLLDFYCQENLVGGTLLVTDKFPQRWQLTVPIDIVLWDAFVKDCISQLTVQKH